MLDTSKVSHFFAVDSNAAIQHAGGKTRCRNGTNTRFLFNVQKLISLITVSAARLMFNQKG